MTACCPAAACRHWSALLMLAGGLYAALGILELIRGRILVRIGDSLDEALSGRVYDALVRLPLRVGTAATALSRCATSTPSARFSPGSARSRSSTCRGFRSISRSASRSIPYRAHRAGRRHRAGRAHAGDRNAHARAHQGGDRSRDQPQRARGSEPAQCRGDDRHGNGAPHGQRMGRGQPAIYAQPAGGERRRRRSRRDLQSAAHDAAIGGARGRRLSGDPSGGHRRHHHRRLDP